MRTKRRWLMPAIITPAAVLAGLTAASAAPQPIFIGSYTAVTHVTGNPSEGGKGDWAIKSFTRVATLTPLGSASKTHCDPLHPSAISACFKFAAAIKDAGAFTSIRFAYTPNQSGSYHNRQITLQVSGSYAGGGKYAVFYASESPHPSDVPAHLTGNIANQVSSYSGTLEAAHLWPELFFKKGTVFGPGGVNFSSWGWTFATTVQHGGVREKQQWLYASSDLAGQSAAAGNITG
jgi:hypothetical protein